MRRSHDAWADEVRTCGERHPSAAREERKAWLTMAALVGGMVVCVAAFALLLAKGHAPSRQEMLVDCSLPPLHFSLRCPRGERFTLLMGVPYTPGERPGSAPPPPQFEGELVLLQPLKPARRLPLTATGAQHSSGLAGKALHCYRLQVGPQTTLDRYLKPEGTYAVAVSFKRPPGRGTTLWLSWFGRPR